MKIYSEIEILDKLQNFKNWKFKNNNLETELKFESFSASIAFVVQLGFLSEKQGRHPSIFINYNKVQLRLCTHDYNGITDFDFDFATAVNLLFSKLQASN